MAETTIEWTDRTWNVVTGCTKVSAGCKNCYAETIDRRFHKRLTGQPFVPWTVKAQREAGTPAVTLHRERLQDPLKWRKPSMVFVNSMSDLFHKDVPHDYILAVFGVMASCPQHTFQVLTKRPERLQELTWTGTPERVVFDLAYRFSGQMLDFKWPLPNVWIGVSVENQKTAEERIPHLLQTPAAVHWLSLEPLLGPIMLDLNWLWEWSHWDDGTGDLCYYLRQGIDWLVIGGESGPKARRMDPDWALDLIKQGRQAGIPVFVKQMGTVLARGWGLKDSKGGDIDEWPPEFQVREYPACSRL